MAHRNDVIETIQHCICTSPEQTKVYKQETSPLNNMYGAYKGHIHHGAFREEGSTFSSCANSSACVFNKKSKYLSK